MDHICFDIETIPQQTAMSKIQNEEFDRRLAYRIKDTTTPEELHDLRRKAMATNPFFGEIMCIGMYRKHNNNGSMEDGETVLTGTETQILSNFWKVIKDFKGLFIHYNGLGFDIPFVIIRSMILGLKPSNDLFLNLRRFTTWPHHDVAMVLANWDKYGMVSLRLACDMMGIPSPKEGEIKAENVEKAYKDGNIKGIGEYCLADTKSTYALFDIQKQYISQSKTKY